MQAPEGAAGDSSSWAGRGSVHTCALPDSEQAPPMELPPETGEVGKGRGGRVLPPRRPHPASPSKASLLFPVPAPSQFQPVGFTETAVLHLSRHAQVPSFPSIPSTSSCSHPQHPVSQAPIHLDAPQTVRPNMDDTEQAPATPW